MGATLIALIWGLALVLTPLILVVTAYYVYFHEGKVVEVVLKLIAALIGYLVITGATVPVFFLFVFVGAHGGELDYEGLIISSLITAVYVGICYLLICLVKGGLIKPWKLFVGLGNKHISIFESKER